MGAVPAENWMFRSTKMRQFYSCREHLWFGSTCLLSNRQLVSQYLTEHIPESLLSFLKVIVPGQTLGLVDLQASKQDLSGQLKFTTYLWQLLVYNAIKDHSCLKLKHSNSFFSDTARIESPIFAIYGTHASWNCVELHGWRTWLGFYTM